MGTKVKCYRCGKEMDLGFKTIKRTLECDHCHGTMTLDVRSDRKLKFTRYVITAIVVSLLMLAVSQFKDISDLTFVLWVMTFAVIISIFADQLCLYIANKLFKFQYVEYHKPKKETKVKTKKERGHLLWTSVKD